MSATPTDKTRPAALPILHPLDEFYVQMGLPLPEVEAVAAERVPEPCRGLLVHREDMTPTLERHHGCAIHIRVLRREQRGDHYYREVVLLRDDNDQPVEFGAIRINLALFPPAARREILEERLPLGHILGGHAIPHFNRPKAFLRVVADDVINRALGLTGPNVLYGRRNTHLDPQGRPLAEIVEILPPEKK
jgi:chorismate-pyruvate lyase